jgi:uncharacterized protein (DUF488 family)
VATIYTVGHSNHPFERFLMLLKRNAIATIADVRSHPASRFNPHFNKAALAAALAQHGIGYLFLGRELGARPDDAACYVRGRVQYARVAQTARFGAGIERALAEAQERRVALMCAEKEPLDCHRTLLVGRALEASGADIVHILTDGSTETAAQAMQRLVRLVGLPQDDLFADHASQVAVACTLREAQIAFVQPAARAAAERS